MQNIMVFRDLPVPDGFNFYTAHREDRNDTLLHEKNSKKIFLLRKGEGVPLKYLWFIIVENKSIILEE